MTRLLSCPVRPNGAVGIMAVLLRLRGVEATGDRRGPAPRFPAVVACAVAGHAFAAAVPARARLRLSYPPGMVRSSVRCRPVETASSTRSTHPEAVMTGQILPFPPIPSPIPSPRPLRRRGPNRAGGDNRRRSEPPPVRALCVASSLPCARGGPSTPPTPGTSRRVPEMRGPVRRRGQRAPRREDPHPRLDDDGCRRRSGASRRGRYTIGLAIVGRPDLLIAPHRRRRRRGRRDAVGRSRRARSA